MLVWWKSVYASDIDCDNYIINTSLIKLFLITMKVIMMSNKEDTNNDNNYNDLVVVGNVND